MILETEKFDREKVRRLERDLSSLMFLQEIPQDDRMNMQVYFSAISRRNGFDQYNSALELIEKYKFFLPYGR